AVTTVMPIAVRDLGGLAIYGWAFSAFMLASILGITVSGRLTDRRGPAVALALGATLFGIGLLAGGAAPALAWLVVGRAGGGAVDGMAGGGARDPGSRRRRALGGDLRQRGALLSVWQAAADARTHLDVVGRSRPGGSRTRWIRRGPRELAAGVHRADARGAPLRHPDDARAPQAR